MFFSSMAVVLKSLSFSKQDHGAVPESKTRQHRIAPHIIFSVSVTSIRSADSGPRDHNQKHIAL